jgi:hypothetical protein
METILVALELVWLFITTYAILIGIVAYVALLAVLAAKGEGWLETFFEKHPWWLEERDMSLLQIIRSRKG